MIYLNSSKRTLKPRQANSPLRKHPDNLKSYKIILRYGTGAKTNATAGVKYPKLKQAKTSSGMGSEPERMRPARVLDIYNSSTIPELYCRDFVARQTSVIGGGGRYDRAACRDTRHTERWRARDRERGRFCSSEAQTIDAVEGGPTPCGCGGESPL